MKTLSASIQQDRQLQTSSGQQFVPAVAMSIREILALSGAMTVAASIILLSVWVAGMEVTAMLSAGTWGVGFIFLAMAVDNHEPLALLHLVTGVTLLILAWLQNSVSSDFTIGSGVLVASWVAVSMFRRMR